jgi:hypothetical protein
MIGSGKIEPVDGFLFHRERHVAIDGERYVGVIHYGWFDPLGCAYPRAPASQRPCSRCSAGPDYRGPCEEPGCGWNGPNRTALRQ